MNEEKVIRDLLFALADNKRKSMIDKIFEHAGDELEDKKSILEIARMSKRQLRFNLRNIIQYYLEQ